MKNLFGLLLLIYAGVATAVPVVWEFDVTEAGLAQDPVLTGSILYDESLNGSVYSSVISSDLSYDASFSGPAGGALQILDFGLTDNGATGMYGKHAGQWFAHPYLDPTVVDGLFEIFFYFDAPLTDAGGEVGFSAEVTFCQPDPLIGCDGGVPTYSERAFSGTLKSSVIPLPAAVWLFGSALAGLGWLRRKQTV